MAKSSGPLNIAALIATASMGGETGESSAEIIRSLSDEQIKAALEQVAEERLRKALGSALKAIRAKDFGEVLAAEVDSAGHIVLHCRPNWEASVTLKKDGKTLYRPVGDYSTGGEPSPVITRTENGQTRFYRAYVGVIETDKEGKLLAR